MKKIIFTIIFASALMLSGKINAQAYSSAVGAKLTFGFLGTYKMEFKENLYADIYGGFSYGLGGGIALELHKPIEDVDNLYWYIGAGVNGGIFPGYSSRTGLRMGVNVVGGVDYSFDEIPLNLSFDWMPGLNLVGGLDPIIASGGLSARYILKTN